MIITIDGPAGTGKSSVAHLLARRLDIDYLDTGSMYRAAALIALERQIDPADGDTLAAAVRAVNLHFDWAMQPPTLHIDDRDVSQRIREMDVNRIVSVVAAQSEVRRVLVQQQRRIAQEHPRLVSEGRDQGSVVFPDAPIRFYLDARVEERARRRLRQLHATGHTDATTESVIDNIRERDHIDSTRRDGPLRCPDGAIVVHTDGMTKHEVVDHLVDLVRQHSATTDSIRSGDTQ
jgi:cytidylate kinase